MKVLQICSTPRKIVTAGLFSSQSVPHTTNLTQEIYSKGKLQEGGCHWAEKQKTELTGCFLGVLGVGVCGAIQGGLGLVVFLDVISSPEPWSCGRVGLREFFLALHPIGYNLSFQESVLEGRNQSDSIEEPFDFWEQVLACSPLDRNRWQKTKKNCQNLHCQL